MVFEWHDHNIAASITNFFPIGNIYDSACEVNLDNNDKDWRWYKWFFK